MIWLNNQNYERQYGCEPFRQEPLEHSMPQMLSVRLKRSLICFLEEKKGGAVVNLVGCKAQNK